MKNQIIWIAAGTAAASAVAFLLMNKPWLKNKAKDLAAELVSNKTGVKKHIVRNAVNHLAK